MLVPKDLLYTNDHEWVRVDGENATIGITDFAQSELGEIVYVEVDTVGDTLNKGDVFGTVEAVKTTSDLFMPVSGEVLQFNPELDEDENDNPSMINQQPYGEGWTIYVKMRDLTEISDLLTPEQYESLVGLS